MAGGLMFVVALSRRLLVKTIDAAVVGIGRIAIDAHCKALNELEEFEFAAVCDVTPSRLEIARDLYPKAAQYTDYEDLLRDAPVDLVVLATPSSDHERQVIQAAQAGKHIVVEKPMCLTAEGATRMIDAARANGVCLTVFHNRRIDADYRLVKQTIEDGLIGAPVVIESRTHEYGYIPFAKDYVNWRLDKSAGGGLVYDWGPHIVDQMLLLAGAMPTSVYGILLSKVYYQETDDYFKIVLRFPDGLVGQLESTLFARIKLPRWYVLGTEGAIWSEWQSARIRTTVAGFDSEIIPDMSKGGGAGFHENTKSYYRSLHAALVNGTEPSVRPEEIRNVIRVIEAAIESSESGQVVRLS
ncbi:MAG: hypothetical protein A2Z18_06890 [Armatimonadetes bacterium RBG_16_58_9]|nr:MAG: hypothetical protein A2Z18_06890 [Armatimonadetes bacterium RBG_16_58_9]